MPVPNQLRRLDSKGIEPLSAVAPAIKNAISQDERGQLPRKRKVEQLYASKSPPLARSVAMESIWAFFAAASVSGRPCVGLDSTLQAKYIGSDMPVASFGKNEIPLSEIISSEVANTT